MEKEAHADISCWNVWLVALPNSGYRYAPVYVNNYYFDEITITPTMGFNHFPNRVCLELERVAEAFGIDTPHGSSQPDCDSAKRLKQSSTFKFKLNFVNFLFDHA